MGSPARDKSNLLAWSQPHGSPHHHSFSLHPAVVVLRQSRGGPDSWVSSRTRGGQGHAVGKAARAEANTSGSVSGPRGRGPGPAQHEALRRERRGRPASPRSSGLRPGGAVGVGEIGEPRVSVVDRSGTRTPGGQVAPQRRSLERCRRGEKKAIRALWPERRDEEGLPCAAGPSPSWPRTPSLGRLSPQTQHHHSSSQRRAPSFWTAITAPPEATKRPDVRGVVTPAARPRERAPSGGQVDQSKADTRGAGHQSQSSSGSGAGPRRSWVGGGRLHPGWSGSGRIWAWREAFSRRFSVPEEPVRLRFGSRSSSPGREEAWCV